MKQHDDETRDAPAAGSGAWAEGEPGATLGRLDPADLRGLRDADLYCFDNDGTLFRSDEVANPAIQREFSAFMEEMGLDVPPPSDARILELTGSPGPVFYKAILPPELAERSEEFRSRCVDREVEEVLARGRLYAGARELLSGLRSEGKKTALVSNGGHRYIEACEQRLDYDALLDGVYHFGKYGLRTKADMISRACADLGASRPVMIGDRASDRDAAVDLGIPFVGCQFGFAGEGELEGAVLLVSDLRELCAVFLGRSCH